MSRASDAFDVLTLAMIGTDPACKSDARFVSDDQPADTLAPICAACPLLDLCAKYADMERPKGGVWAGKRYRTYKSREATA